MKAYMKLVAAACAAGLLLGSCTAPTDLSANRERTVQGADGRLDINPGIADFGLCYPDSTSKRYQVTLTNLSTTDSLPITPVALVNGRSGFSIAAGQEIPPYLAPMGRPGASLQFAAAFTPHEFGDFTDTIRFNGVTSPQLILRASVPAVWVEDVGFNVVDAAFIVDTTLRVVNRSPGPVRINAIIIEGDSTTIRLISVPILPVSIGPNSEYSFTIRFTPPHPGFRFYSGRLRFDISGTEFPVDNLCQVTAKEP